MILQTGYIETWRNISSGAPTMGMIVGYAGDQAHVTLTRGQARQLAKRLLKFADSKSQTKKVKRCRSKWSTASRN